MKRYITAKTKLGDSDIDSDIVVSTNLVLFNTQLIKILNQLIKQPSTPNKEKRK